MISLLIFGYFFIFVKTQKYYYIEFTFPNCTGEIKKASISYSMSDGSQCMKAALNNYQQYVCSESSGKYTWKEFTSPSCGLGDLVQSIDLELGCDGSGKLHLCDESNGESPIFGDLRIGKSSVYYVAEMITFHDSECTIERGLSYDFLRMGNHCNVNNQKLEAKKSSEKETMVMKKTSYKSEKCQDEEKVEKRVSRKPFYVWEREQKAKSDAKAYESICERFAEGWYFKSFMIQLGDDSTALDADPPTTKDPPIIPGGVGFLLVMFIIAMIFLAVCMTMIAFLGVGLVTNDLISHVKKNKKIKKMKKKTKLEKERNVLVDDECLPEDESKMGEEKRKAYEYMQELWDEAERKKKKKLEEDEEDIKEIVKKATEKWKDLDYKIGLQYMKQEMRKRGEREDKERERKRLQFEEDLKKENNPSYKNPYSTEGYEIK